MKKHNSLWRNLFFCFALHRSQIRFLVLFAVLFLVLDTLYLLGNRTPLRDFVLATMTARPTAAIINSITPRNGVVLKGNMLISDHSAMAVVSGCEGAQAVIILIAAILAFPLRTRQKLLGVVCGVLLLYVLNLARIVGLHYMSGFSVGTFEFAHWCVGQTLVVIVSFAFFVFWVTMERTGHAG